MNSFAPRLRSAKPHILRIVGLSLGVWVVVSALFLQTDTNNQGEFYDPQTRIPTLDLGLVLATLFGECLAVGAIVYGLVIAVLRAGRAPRSTRPDKSAF